MSDRIDIAAIRARLAAATPGPWEQWKGHLDVMAHVFDNTERSCGGERVCGVDSFRANDDDPDPDLTGCGCEDEGCATRYPRLHADADLIARAPTDIAALCDEVERLRASNERLRHVVGLDEAIYMDLARSAGFDHEPPSDARQCIAAVHALAAERDALRADVIRYADGVASAERGIAAQDEEIATLREIIAGRTTPPTDAEIEAHAQDGGRWVVRFDGLTYHSPCEGARSWRDDVCEAWETAGRWWALDASGAPCAWPVVPRG